MNSTSANRALTASERALATLMLGNGTQDARSYLAQLDEVEVTPWRCACGCASINFEVKGHPPAPPGVRVLGDFLCGSVDTPAGAFIYESGGLLSGLEVYSLASDAPLVLPDAPLRPMA